MERLAWLREQLPISTSTQIILLTLATAYGVWMLTKRKLRLPPGPTPLPLIGNALAFFKDDLDKCVDKWHKKYGPVITFSAGTQIMVSINEIEALNEAFVKRGADFSGRPFLYSMNLFTEGNSSILMASYGELWKFQRKVASQALRQYLTGTQLEERVNEALEPVIDSMLQEKDPFNPQTHISLAVFNVLNAICFGTVMELDDPTFKLLVNNFDKANALFGNGFLEDFFPPLRYWPTSRFKECKTIFDGFNEWIHKNMDERKKNFNPDEVSNLTENIILAKQQVESDANCSISQLFTDTHAAQTLADVFSGGVDTSRTTLGWIFLVVAACPDIQKKLHEEVDRVIGMGVPGKEHRSKLVYVEAVMYEALRMYPVAPLGMPHAAMCDTTLGEYDIPVGTTVIPNFMAILHDPKHWDDPNSFRPERFLDETCTKIVSRGQSWTPFSLGHRACLGESMAKLQMGYTIAGLVQKLHFSLSGDDTPDLSNNQVGFVNRPRDYKIVVSRR